VSSLPALCNPGNGVEPTDIVMLSNNGVSLPYYCQSTNSWAALGGGSVATLNPTSLSFGTLNVGYTQQLQVTLCAGTLGPTGICTVASPQSFSLVSVGSTDPTNFPVQGYNCGAIIAPGTTCTIYVSFWPHSAGTKTATLNVVTSISSAPIPVSGGGAGPTVATPALSSIALSPSTASISDVTPTNTVQLTATETRSDSSTLNVTNYNVGWNASGGSSSSPWTLLNSTGTGVHTSVSSLAATSISTTSSSLLACFTRANTSASATISVTDSLGNAFVSTAIAADHGAAINNQWFFAVNKGSGADILTENSSVATTLEMQCLEYSGASQSISAVLDVVKAGNNASSATTSITTGSFTTTGISDLILVGATDYGSQNCGISPEFTAGTNYSMVANDLAANCGPMGIEARTGVAAGTYAGTMTDSVSTTTWQGYAISFIAGTTSSVASVNASGFVTGLNPGTSTISVNAGAVSGTPNGNIRTNNATGQTGQTSITCTLPLPVANNDTIVVAVSSADTSSSYSVPTDSAGNTYTLVSPSSSAPSRGTGSSQAIYDSQGVVGSTAVIITATFGSGGATGPNIICADMLGLSGGVDAQAVATGNNLNPTNSVTATAASDVLFSAVVSPGRVTTGVFPAPIGRTGWSSMQYTDLFSSGSQTDSSTLSAGGDWLMNSVLFKSVALGTATITVSTRASSTYSVSSQQPVADVFLPGSVFSTVLPSDVGSHCLGNVACSSSDPSIAIINNTFASSDAAGGYSTSASTSPANTTSSQGNGFYYCDQSCPVFLITSGSGPCSGASATYCAAGKYFHLPSGAQWDSCEGDQNIAIWDQSTDIDPTPGGRILVSYFFGSTTVCSVRALPTTCTATTPAQAAVNPNCQYTLYYNAVDYAFTDPLGGIADGINSAGFGASVPLPRELEIENNSIPHALLLGVDCVQSTGGVANAPAYPANGNVNPCPGTVANAPLNGSLFYIDSSYNCSTLPAWQKPFCTALQTYGGYLHVTGGAGYQTGLFVLPIEGGTAHAFANLNDPMWNEPNPTGTTAWIIANGVTSCPSGGYPKICTGTNGLEVVEDSATTAEKAVWFIFQMPGLITGHHLHIVDPCLVKRINGQPGAC
jgi:hypothetical protein